MFRISSQQSCSLASTFLFIPDTVCHRLVRSLDVERFRFDDVVVPPHEKEFINQSLMQLTCSGMPGWYSTPAFADGSRLSLDLSVAGQVTITAFGEGIASDSQILTPAHPMWGWIRNGPVYAKLIREWQEWAATPAPAEKREEALKKVTECMTWGTTELFLYNLNLTSLPELPPFLTKLNVSLNQLTALPDLPDLLHSLDAQNNKLSSLPDLPDLLEILLVSSNKLTAMPPLPNSITTLEVLWNKLIALPDLPNLITKLEFSGNKLTSLPTLPDSLRVLDAQNNELSSLPDLPNSITTLDVRWNKLTALPTLPDSLRVLDASNNRLPPPPPLLGLLQWQNVGFLFRRPVSSVLESAVILWYPEEWQRTVRTAWTPRATVENAGAFTRFLKQLNKNVCACLPEFREQVAAWLDELLATPELCTLSFAIAQEASATCTDRAALGWNNMQVARLLFHAVRNEQTTTDEFITLARQIFRFRETERIAGEKVRFLTAAQKRVDEIEVYLAYQTRLKGPLGLPDCLASEMQFMNLAHVTPEDIRIARKEVFLAEVSEFGNWLNNWSPCQQFLLKRMSEDEREALNERRIAVYREKLEEIRLEFSEAGSGTDVDRILGVRATEATNNAIFGPLAEQTFFMPTGQSSKGKEKG